MKTGMGYDLNLHVLRCVYVQHNCSIRSLVLKNTTKQVDVTAKRQIQDNEFMDQHCGYTKPSVRPTIDPNQSRDFHPAVLLIWWER